VIPVDLYCKTQQGFESGAKQQFFLRPLFWSSITPNQTTVTTRITKRRGFRQIRQLIFDFHHPQIHTERQTGCWFHTETSVYCVDFSGFSAFAPVRALPRTANRIAFYLCNIVRADQVPAPGKGKLPM
jgi:hypothetical protein